MSSIIQESLKKRKQIFLSFVCFVYTYDKQLQNLLPFCAENVLHNNLLNDALQHRFFLFQEDSETKVEKITMKLGEYRIAIC